MSDEQVTKTCRVCNTEKPAKEYGRADRPGGRRLVCKACVAKNRANHRARIKRKTEAKKRKNAAIERMAKTNSEKLKRKDHSGKSKWCNRCASRQPIEDFHKSPTNHDGLVNYCKECSRIYRKHYYQECVDDGRESARRKRRRPEQRSAQLQKSYGITLEQYAAMLESQGGRCAICRVPPKSRKQFAVDHDHQTGKIRGLLCSRCNQGLGHFNDRIGILLYAIAYLRSDRFKEYDPVPGHLYSAGAGI